MRFNNTRRLLVLAAATAVIAAACGGAADDSVAIGDDQPIEAPEAAPLDFTATQLSGDAFAGDELEGTDTVLWFWAPWCTSCRAEAPDVIEAADEFEGSVEIVGVPGRGATDEMAGFVSDTGTGSLRHVVDDDGSIWRDFGIIGQPAFAFVNDDGTAEVFVGGLGRDALVERMNALASS